ncbi:MAG TPA: TPM domain-containing protein [Thermomicrobiaceae bacterium]|nr:TPM domain-containing protein [Thermomicrobiaceae bacterium]
MMRRAWLVILLFLCLPLAARADSSYGTPAPGQHIYDRSGLLTPAQVRDLEHRAALVDQAGAPTIVYIQMRNVSDGATAADAQVLMDEWDVESAPGARDGLVIFVNLSSLSPVHGHAALYAGATHYQGGKLPKSELQSIYDTSMAPRLKSDDLYGALAAGLDAVAHQLQFGKIPSNRAATLMKYLREPLEGLAVVGAALVGLVAWRVRQSRLARGIDAPPTTTPPADLSPAMAGALVDGRVSDRLMEATLLDLARRGALSIDPAEHHKAQIRLLDARVAKAPMERQLWDQLAIEATPDSVVSSGRLGSLRREWKQAQEDLEQSLEEQGLFDPGIGARRNPGYIAGGFALLAAFGLWRVLGGLHDQWSALSIVLLALAGAAAIWAAYSLPATSAAGEKLAADWRGYRKGIKSAAKGPIHGADLDLDTVFPFAVALGVAGAFDHRLKEAEKSGYNPAWLSRTLTSGTPGQRTHYYNTWHAFHSSVTPSSSGGSGGGASSGGGSAGGSF